MGELFGFLGPNGAGKTTTIRILTTLLRPTRGTAAVFGHDVLEEPQMAMRRVGFMPENPGFYGGLTGADHLRYWGRLYGLPPRDLDGRVQGLLTRVNLAEAAEKKAKAYSLGMRRRLALAGALVADPELLILDEPTLGLDPGGMAFVRSLLRELHEEGRTVFLSSHILSEVEKVCTRVGVLNRGRLLRVDSPRNLVRALGDVGGGLRVETRGVPEDVREELHEVAGVTRVAMDGDYLFVMGTLDDDGVAEVNRRLVAAGVSVLSSQRLEADLEQAFLRMTQEGE